MQDVLLVVQEAQVQPGLDGLLLDGLQGVELVQVGHQEDRPEAPDPQGLHELVGLERKHGEFVQVVLVSPEDLPVYLVLVEEGWSAEYL